MSRTITTSGTVGIALTNPEDNPVTITSAAAIVTTGKYALAGTGATVWFITNSGTLSADGFGITLASGGSVNNETANDSGAFIYGYGGGIVISGGAGTVTNTGEILIGNTRASGVRLEQGGQVANGSAQETGARIQGVYVTGGSGTVTNYGGIDGYFQAIDLADGGTLTNAGGIEGHFTGVVVGGGVGAVINSGQINSTAGLGVVLSSGGDVTNEAGASIGGFYDGLYIGGGTGTVTNLGTVSALIYGSGVELGDGGVVVNGSKNDTTARIYADNGYAITVLGAAGTVVNDGIIDLHGIYLGEGGTVTNGSAAITTAFVASVYVARGLATIINDGAMGEITFERGGGTVINNGTVTGVDGGTGPAIVFMAGDDQLAVDPGAVFLGGVTASSTGSNVLELMHARSAGVLDGIGAEFVNFGTLALDKAAKWSLSGTNVLTGGGVLDLGLDSRLVVDGRLTEARELHLAGAGVLDLTSSGEVEVGTAGEAAPGKVTVDTDGTLAGTGQVRHAVIDSGSILANGGTLAFSGNVFGSGAVAIDPGAVLWAGQDLTPAVQFMAGGADTLALAQPGSVTAILSGFAATDTIDLLGQVATGLSYSGSTGILTVDGSSGTIAMLHFSGSYTMGDFDDPSDGHGGTLITLG